MLSVVGDVPVDSKVPMVTSSISRICQPSLQRCSQRQCLCACIYRSECVHCECRVCRPNLRRCSQGSVCVRVLIGVSACVVSVLLYCVILKKNLIKQYSYRQAYILFLQYKLYTDNFYINTYLLIYIIFQICKVLF